MARVNAKDWITVEGLTKIQGWARDGLTDEQIAHNIGCSRSTLYVWIKKYTDISDALKRGKEVIDRQVENALLKRALGYETVETTKERVFDEFTGEYKKVETKEVTKFVAPDVTAQIFWLKNRKPSEWRDKRDVEHSGEMTTNVNNMNNLSEDELRKLAKLDGD
ncbi:helix-turn-helix domain-containing protein [Mammaliicoccus sp. M-M49]|uniref:helix-turn-helix domain-containing protein n=1 Tax=Mammaliicoccus sp. M-M49 TaxID=2898708 RepID=UPI001EFBB348|nr:helix-turn-helix domain-containing protein [Mammaliicoccus sp. M-M49]